MSTDARSFVFGQVKISNGAEATRSPTLPVICDNPTGQLNVPPVRLVRLPSGRLRLGTSPVLTGSPPTANTMGMVEVAACAASAAGSPPVASAETMMTIAADPSVRRPHRHHRRSPHLGIRMTHHPHIHMIVPGGGISLDGRRWISSRPPSSCRCGCWHALPPPVPDPADRLHQAGRLAFFGTQAGLADRRPSCVISPLSGTSGSWSMPSRRSPAPRPCSPIFALYPPGRHLEPAADCVRRDRRHLPLQGLSPRWPRAQRVMTLAPTSSSAASCSMSCQGFHRIRQSPLRRMLLLLRS